MIVLDRDAVRDLVDLDAARHAVRAALIAQARGAATPPAVLYLDLGSKRGDVHVKGAWLEHSYAQLEALSRVRRPATVAVWGRNPEAAERIAAQARDELLLHAEVSEAVETAVAHADVVVTTTSARAPLFRAEAARPDALIVAVGADAPGKQELDPRLLTSADLLVADDADQCSTQGELQHAARHLNPIALGALLDGCANDQLLRRRGGTVVDLTGLGVQDAAVASLAIEGHPDVAGRVRDPATSSEARRHGETSGPDIVRGG